MVQKPHNGMSITPEIRHHQIRIREVRLDVFLDCRIEPVAVTGVRKIGVVFFLTHLNESEAQSGWQAGFLLHQLRCMDNACHVALPNGQHTYHWIVLCLQDASQSRAIRAFFYRAQVSRSWPESQVFPARYSAPRHGLISRQAREASRAIRRQIFTSRRRRSRPCSSRPVISASAVENLLVGAPGLEPGTR